MQLKYWAHIQRREKGHPLKIAEKISFKEKKRGRPAKTWNDTIRENMEKIPGMSKSLLIKLAKHKDLFNKKVEVIYDTVGSEEESESEMED